MKVELRSEGGGYEEPEAQEISVVWDGSDYCGPRRLVLRVEDSDSDPELTLYHAEGEPETVRLRLYSEDRIERDYEAAQRQREREEWFATASLEDIEAKLNEEWAERERMEAMFRPFREAINRQLYSSSPLLSAKKGKPTFTRGSWS